MSRFAMRVLPAAGAAAFAVALTVGAGAPVGALPEPGPITEASDLLGVWLGEVTGYQEGQEVDWQYRMTVRKAKGQAGVAWEEWRDCEGHERACAAGTGTGGGWSQPTRVLLVLDAEHGIHGVSERGFLTAPAATDSDTLHVVVVCQGSSGGGWTQVPVTSGATQRAMTTNSSGAFAVSGSMSREPTEAGKAAH